MRHRIVAVLAGIWLLGAPVVAWRRSRGVELSWRSVEVTSKQIVDSWCLANYSHDPVTLDRVRAKCGIVVEGGGRQVLAPGGQVTVRLRVLRSRGGGPYEGRLLALGLSGEIVAQGRYSITDEMKVDVVPAVADLSKDTTRSIEVRFVSRVVPAGEPVITAPEGVKVEAVRGTDRVWKVVVTRGPGATLEGWRESVALRWQEGVVLLPLQTPRAKYAHPTAFLLDQGGAPATMRVRVADPSGNAVGARVQCTASQKQWPVSGIDISHSGMRILVVCIQSVLDCCETSKCVLSLTLLDERGAPLEEYPLSVDRLRRPE